MNYKVIRYEDNYGVVFYIKKRYLGLFWLKMCGINGFFNKFATVDAAINEIKAHRKSKSIDVVYKE